MKERKGQRATYWLMVLCCVSIFFCDVNAWAFVSKFMSVQVRQGNIRNSPSFLGKVVLKVNYGDRLINLGEYQGWVNVRLSNKNLGGWIHQSALTTKKILLNAGAADVKNYAGSDEVALAGKGFNKQVENRIRAKNPSMNFRWIDRMEAMKVRQDEVSLFLKNGEVKPKGGLL